MDRQRIDYLYQQYLDRRLSVEELEELRKLVDTESFRTIIGERLDEDWEQISPTLMDQIPDQQMRLIYDRLSKRLPHRSPQMRRSFTIRRLLPYAAVLLLAAAVSIFIWRQQNSDHSTTVDIPPGGNYATLTLSDGRSIPLSSEHTGIITDDEVKYQDGVSLGALATSEYQLNTPRGGQYQVTLPDGTEVWLNSESSLSYPPQFDSKARIVRLSGEAYFKVTRKADKTPFLVQTAKQTVEVLGTEFNLSVYPDDPIAATTLVTGLVQVSSVINEQQGDVSPTLLAPGQQAIVNGAQINVRPVNTNDYTAWREGMFRFNEEALGMIMQRIARWYDLEVEYKDEALRQEAFTGNITRRQNAAHVLTWLEKAGDVQFRMEGRKILVERKKK